MFSYFSQKTGFDISCKLSASQTMYMKCHNHFFSGKNNKNIMNFSSAELAQRVLKVNIDNRFEMNQRTKPSTIRLVQPAKTQVSLHTRAISSVFHHVNMPI